MLRHAPCPGRYPVRTLICGPRVAALSLPFSSFLKSLPRLRSVELSHSYIDGVGLLALSQMKGAHTRFGSPSSVSARLAEIGARSLKLRCVFSSVSPCVLWLRVECDFAFVFCSGRCNSCIWSILRAVSVIMLVRLPWQV